MKKAIFTSIAVSLFFGMMTSCTAGSSSAGNTGMALAAPGSDYTFRTTMKGNSKGKSFSHAVSVTCYQGRWQKLFTGYSGNSEPSVNSPVSREAVTWFATAQLPSPNTPCNEWDVWNGQFKGLLSGEAVPSIAVAGMKVVPATGSTWVPPVNAWSGDKKVWKKLKNSYGTEISVSFQNAPSHRNGYMASTAFRTRVEMHPDNTTKAHVHPGVVFYGNLGQPFPSCTQTSGWCSALTGLLNQPAPSYPANASRDWVHSWSGHRN